MLSEIELKLKFIEVSAEVRVKWVGVQVEAVEEKPGVEFEARGELQPKWGRVCSHRRGWAGTEKAAGQRLGEHSSKVCDAESQGLAEKRSRGFPECPWAQKNGELYI